MAASKVKRKMLDRHGLWMSNLKYECRVLLGLAAAAAATGQFTAQPPSALKKRASLLDRGLSRLSTTSIILLAVVMGIRGFWKVFVFDLFICEQKRLFIT